MNLNNLGISNLPKPESIFKPPNIDFTNPNLASEFHKRLVEMINDFDDKLSETEEVGMRLVSFGQTIQFHVENIGYYNPSLITFYGKTGDGNKIELIQHVTQISFLLMAVPRLNPEEPKRKIGFGT
ncbi:DUF6173 family protein [Lysinibacillus sp. 1P01SD]|uniref:DUF6173 family protein n=1 Tax=Lysinibacillus sp. 1P01SD TaxID=3132285 RepID=UPI0039A1F296